MEANGTNEHRGPPLVNESDALQWAQQELIALVNIRSYSHEEAALAAHLAERLDQWDLPVHIDPVAGSGPNLLVGWDAAPELLLTAHTDTITPTWDWRDARVDGAVVHGLGAQDDKGGIVTCLLALLLARAAGLDLARLPIGVGLCVDEEAGGTGSLHMAAELMPSYVIALEGTDLRVATAEAGYVDGWIDVDGTAAHHSFGGDGDNAIEHAAALIRDCVAAEFTTTSHPLGAPHRVSVHAFSSPAARNVVPDHARFFLEAQIFAPTFPEQVIAELEQLCSRHRARYTVEEAVCGFETAADAALPAAMLAATASVLGDIRGPTYMPAWTDAHNFAEVAGAQAVVFGPGHLRSAHGPNEHVDLREIVKAARVLAAVMSDFASSGGWRPTALRAT
jgi:acetylornithine deacetylase/succinyl-diaminopimelate desuccinylase-like protein